jgi:Ca2+-binding EF-hand superfamily protein
LFFAFFYFQIRRYAFKAFDQNKNNEIDFSEFLVAISIIAHGDIRKKLEAAFNIFDLDKNGRIDRSEMEKLLAEIYDMIGEDAWDDDDDSPANLVKEIMKKLDKNMDGNVTKDEFIDGCMQDKHLRELLTPTLISDPNCLYKLVK